MFRELNKLLFLIIFAKQLSRYHSYINSSKDILSQYKGEEPFPSFLRKFFSQNKKYGSKDRKHISHLCYCYFRLGKSMTAISIEEQLLVGLFLCSSESNEILKELKPEWNEAVATNIEEKISLTGISISIQNIFSWQNELSETIDANEFIYSHLQQPDLFLRLRPGKEALVKQKLKTAGISFDVVSETCLVLPNSSKIDEVIELDKEAVVQDYSSQRVGEFLHPFRKRQSDQVWDCCAASGGKSIMAKDILGEIDLTVTDVRESILINLKKRFAAAGIKNYKSVIADLSQPLKYFDNESFNIIIADVPCSGSGTWGRTPEQLIFFDDKKIEEYTGLQKTIISNVIPKLKIDGYLLYITCSVFKKENEEVIDFIQEKFHLGVVKVELLKGYDNKADTMFAALLQKPPEIIH